MARRRKKQRPQPPQSTYSDRTPRPPLPTSLRTRQARSSPSGLVRGRTELDFENSGLAYSCNYFDMGWNRSAAKIQEHGMEPSKVPFGTVFRVPGFQANTLDCVKLDDFVGPWNVGRGISPDAPESPNTRVLEKRSSPSTLILVNRIEASPSVSI